LARRRGTSCIVRRRAKAACRGTPVNSTLWFLLEFEARRSCSSLHRCRPSIARAAGPSQAATPFSPHAVTVVPQRLMSAPVVPRQGWHFAALSSRLWSSRRSIHGLLRGTGSMCGEPRSRLLAARRGRSGESASVAAIGFAVSAAAEHNLSVEATATGGRRIHAIQSHAAGVCASPSR
jgi:hypothetical protein